VATVQVVLRLAVPMLWIVTACAERPGDGEIASRRDSAGIAIVSSARDQWTDADRWSVDTIPSLVIGKANTDAPYLFSGIVGTIRLSDGTIVVADRQTMELRFFSQDGTFLRAAGRRGEGPGEFARLIGLRRCGVDRIYAEDLARNTHVLDIFTPTGMFVRQMTPSAGPAHSVAHIECAPDGDLVIVDFGFSETPKQSTRYVESDSVWLFDSTATPRQPFGELPYLDRVFLLGASGAGGTGTTHPYGRVTSFAMDSARIYIAGFYGRDVHVLDRDGKLVAIWRGPTEPLAATDRAAADYRAAALHGRDSSLRARFDLAGITMPDTIPVYATLLVDDAGNVWAQRFAPPWEEKRDWSVFARDGALLGTLQMPAAFRVAEIGRDYVLGVLTDDDGVERPAVFALRRPTAAQQ
jgi:6-bladed beta-propeller